MGDVGGTNIRLQLGVVDSLGFHVAGEPQYYKTAEIKLIGFSELIKKFLNTHTDSETYPQWGVFAVAGFVECHTTAKLANAEYCKIDGNQIKEDLEMEKIVILNDFEGTAHGLLDAKSEDMQ